MNKERFFTVRWNNLLAVAVGFPILVYVVVLLSTSVMSDQAGFIAFAIIGAVY